MLAVWVATLIFPVLIRDYAFIPAAGLFEPWRFITAAFLHSIPLPFHVGFNCWALWVVGRALEPILGHVRLFASFVICAISASFACCLAALVDKQAWLSITVGASGAVFGFFGIMLAIQKLLRLPAGEMIALIGINLAIGFVLPNVAWVAHLGGLGAGLIIGAYTAWRLRHATLIEVPLTDHASASEPANPDSPNNETPETPETPAETPAETAAEPPEILDAKASENSKTILLHQVSTGERVADTIFYTLFLAVLVGGNWLFYHFTYATIYSLFGW